MMIEAAPLNSYSLEDQAFFKFWYGHMQGDTMTGALADVSHSTARYIWDAALARCTEVPALKKAIKDADDVIGDCEGVGLLHYWHGDSREDSRLIVESILKK